MMCCLFLVPYLETSPRVYPRNPNPRLLVKSLVATMLPVTHVIFDLDDLLISSGCHYFNAISKFLQKFGHTYTFDVRRKLQGRKFEIAAGILVKEYNLPVEPQEIVDFVHGSITPDLWKDVKLLPGAAKVIEYFDSHGIPMAVATGSEAEQLEYKMHSNRDVWDRMHHIVPTGGNPEVSGHFTFLSIIHAPVRY